MTEFTNKRLIELLKELNEAIESGKLSSYGIVVPDSLKEALETVRQGNYGIAETEKWEKVGRKPNEFRKGDIVKVKNPYGAPLEAGDLVEVACDSETSTTVFVTAKEWAVSVSELITPAEARFDA